MTARQSLLRLLQTRALLHGDFVLSSGARASYYLDARLVTLSGIGSRLVGEVMLDALDAVAPEPPDAVGGMSIGADPLVTAITVTSALRARPIDGLLVRKAPKGHGTGRRVEGPIRRGMRVVVVEDTVTTGTSLLAAVEAIREAGCHVESVVALIDRNEGGRERIERTGLRFGALFDIDEVLEGVAGPTG